MELFTVGFPIAFSPENLLFCFLGVFLGTFIGVLPGLGSLTAVSLLMPLTFYLDPIPAILMLAGVFYGCEYGGSTASILLNVPGTASTAVTCLDGYPMSKQGRAGVALFTVTMASFIGGSVGILALIFLTPVIVPLTFAFGPAEYFAAMLFALLASATVGQGAPVKSIAMVLLGLLLGCVGPDISTGVVRYTFGHVSLYDGINLAVLAMGLFGVAEIIASMNIPQDAAAVRQVGLRSMLPAREDVRRSVFPIARGTLIGGVLGALPGAGPTISSLISYATEKRISRHPERFGKGAIEGIASPEASNNASVQTAFIPTLLLSIPGTPTLAIILGALMIAGVTPGPRMLTEHADLFWGLIASFWIGNVLLVILNLPLIGLWVRLLQVPRHFLYPAVICLICAGAYSLNQNAFDVVLVLLFGALGYAMRLLEFEPAPLLIGFILGPLVEDNFRRAMLLARGDFLGLFASPVASVLLVASMFMALWVVWSAVRPARIVPAET